jgi:hypothetical protein
MKLKIDRFDYSKLNYDKILNDIAFVMAKPNEEYGGKAEWLCYDLRNREEVDYNHYPIYKGRFGNALIALNDGKITNKLYLIDNKKFDLIKNRYTKTITIEELEKCATHTIERKEV